MNPERIGGVVRFLRVRQRLTQVALSVRAGVTRRAISRLECGGARQLSLGTIEAVLAGLGARIDVRVLWNGPELDRLLDAAHAALGAAVKQRLERWGWIVRVEVSYNRYGDRGRIDLLAWHAATRILLVIELKSDLVDVQALLGSIDVKARLSRHVAAQFGWEVGQVVPAIVFVEDRATRDHLQRVDALFDQFSLRGRLATAWLRRPSGRPTGILWFATAVTRGQRRVGQRVYLRQSERAAS